MYLRVHVMYFMNSFSLFSVPVFLFLNGIYTSGQRFLSVWLNTGKVRDSRTMSWTMDEKVRLHFGPVKAQDH